MVDNDVMTGDNGKDFEFYSTSLEDIKKIQNSAEDEWLIKWLKTQIYIKNISHLYLSF